MKPQHGTIGLLVGLCVSLVSARLPAGEQPSGNVIDLAGQWRFALDPAKEGVKKGFFKQELSQRIKLPGSTDEAGFGALNRAKPTLDGLYRLYSYEGPAWYQRDVEIPAAWKGRWGVLFIERAHGETQVWFDEEECGIQNSLVAAQEFFVGGVAPGKHRLTVCMDNTRKFDLGPFPSVLYEGTQTNWNGLIGRLELRAAPRRSIIKSQRVLAKNDGAMEVEVEVAGTTSLPTDGAVSVEVSEKATGKVVGRGETRFNHPRGPAPPGHDIFATAGWVNVTVKFDSPPKLWSEFSPELYVVNTRLTVDGKPDATATARTEFGFRNFAAEGTHFTMNGRSISLRGTLECGIFPKTGYPPMDVPSWLRIMKIIKSYGLNFIRFHSWCPPDAAFTAADIEGVVIQAEGPIANTNVGKNPPRDAFLEQEFLRMVRTYGNHPSFCLMTLGNEYGGDDKLLSHWVDMLKKEDPRRLYCSPTCGQNTANRQFTETYIHGVRGPGTDWDFRYDIANQDRPVTSHEVGQWTFFPNFDEIKKYSGVLAAKNFELVRDDLAGKQMLDLAPRFFQATGKQAVLLYKEEIESLMRTPGYQVFSLLDLHDYPGQGTSLIGLLDPFWDSKGFITPAVHRRYCGPVVPLARLKKRTFTADEPLVAAVEIAQFGPKDFHNARPAWAITDSQGHVIASGELPAVDLPTGKLTALGQIIASLAKAPAPCKLSLAVSLAGTDVANDWDIWVYPPAAPIAPPADVTIASHWPEAKAALAAGKKVLFLPAAKEKFARALPGKFMPVFWSPIWFPTQVPNTMSILCDPANPALAGFPTEFYSNWQWWDLLNASQSVILDVTPAEFRPIVEVIDNFSRNHKLGNVFEARVGKGRLLVCTIDLRSLAKNSPAARQLLASLYAYAGSDRFQPAAELDAKALDALFVPATGGGKKKP